MPRSQFSVPNSFSSTQLYKEVIRRYNTNYPRCFCNHCCTVLDSLRHSLETKAREDILLSCPESSHKEEYQHQISKHYFTPKKGKEREEKQGERELEEKLQIGIDICIPHLMEEPPGCLSTEILQRFSIPEHKKTEYLNTIENFSFQCQDGDVVRFFLPLPPQNSHSDIRNLREAIIGLAEDISQMKDQDMIKANLFVLEDMVQTYQKLVSGCS